MNSILRHYAAMRECDGFTAPSDYVREFYADYVWDPSFFHTLPNGVDAALFKPMDKAAAKREIAKMVGDDRIESACRQSGIFPGCSRRKGHPST